MGIFLLTNGLITFHRELIACFICLNFYDLDPVYDPTQIMGRGLNYVVEILWRFVVYLELGFNWSKTLGNAYSFPSNLAGLASSSAKIKLHMDYSSEFV